MAKTVNQEHIEKYFSEAVKASETGRPFPSHPIQPEEAPFWGELYQSILSVHLTENREAADLFAEATDRLHDDPEADLTDLFEKVPEREKDGFNTALNGWRFGQEHKEEILIAYAF